MAEGFERLSLPGDLDIARDVRFAGDLTGWFARRP
jgi:hypothetical protein